MNDKKQMQNIIECEKERLNKLIERLDYNFNNHIIQKQSEKIDKLIIDYVKTIK